MLKKDITTDVIEFVQERIQWKKIDSSLCTLIQMEAYNNWIPELTAYNIKQISLMNNDTTIASPEKTADSLLFDQYESSSYIQTYERVKEKDYIKKSRILSSYSDFLEYINWYLKDYKPSYIPDLPLALEPEWDEMIIALTDLHIWKNNTDHIIERLWAIADYIIDWSPSKVHIFCLWDLVESIIQDGMHSGQIETMEPVYWFNLIMKTVEILESFVWAIHSHWIHIDFHWITGNHDRISKLKDDDKVRIWWLIIYELLKRSSERMSNINIIAHSEHIVPIDIDNKRYIISHWDIARIAKRKPYDIVWTHWDTNKEHNIILYGHYHTINIQEAKWVTMVWLPWLAWPWDYDKKQLDVHSEPGFLHIVHNPYGSVDINIKRLYNGW